MVSFYAISPVILYFEGLISDFVGQILKSELASLRGLALELPRQMARSMQRANTVLQHHDNMMQSQTSNITGLAYFHY
jgi:hypothetical protein